MSLNDVLKEIEKFFQEKIASKEVVYGGCINSSYTISLESNQKFFLKTNFTAPDDMFKAEAHGLECLQHINCIRIPKVITFSNNFLLLEYISQGEKHINFMRFFGKQLALQHKVTNKYWGNEIDNYLGKTFQKNLPQIPFNPKTCEQDWCNFYFEYRLLYQYKLLEKKEMVDSKFAKLFSKVEKKLPRILKNNAEGPALLHGDLWGGNFIIDNFGKPVLIDPAVYYGHRETDLAMTKIFGGFDNDFYNSYDEEYPLKEGYLYRENIYKLYHFMNHMNLFGCSYYDSCIKILEGYSA